jgi:hypothetical protein
MRCTFTACPHRASLVWLPMADHAVAICWLHRAPAAIAAMRRLLA